MNKKMLYEVFSQQEKWCYSKKSQQFFMAKVEGKYIVPFKTLFLHLSIYMEDGEGIARQFLCLIRNCTNWEIEEIGDIYFLTKKALKGFTKKDAIRQLRKYAKEAKA